MYGCEKDRVVTTEEENRNIVPQKGEIDKVVSLFYHTYKAEGARKMQPRIKRFYTGISIKRIQKWLNSNENHFKINPIFSNKPPLSPVASKTVQSMPITKLNIITFFHCWTYSQGLWNSNHYPTKIPTKC